ncbi:MAG: hypothetical protein ACI87E_002066 [Mariniblastus sp.]|jgi:hypothetical protein
MMQLRRWKSRSCVSRIGWQLTRLGCPTDGFSDEAPNEAQNVDQFDVTLHHRTSNENEGVYEVPLRQMLCWPPLNAFTNELAQ